MFAQIAIFFIKILIGTSLGILGIYNAKMKNRNKIKKMRIFDELNLEVQNEIVTTAVRYAKGEIAEFNLPASTDVIALAVQYDTMYFTTPLDYSGLDLETITAWVGSRPIKRP
jgi:hypothetical protein